MLVSLRNLAFCYHGSVMETTWKVSMNVRISSAERAFRKSRRVSKSSARRTRWRVSGASDRQSSRRASHYVLRAGFIFISKRCLDGGHTWTPGWSDATLMRAGITGAIYRRYSRIVSRCSSCITVCIVLLPTSELMRRPRKITSTRRYVLCPRDTYTDFPSWIVNHINREMNFLFP